MEKCWDAKPENRPTFAAIFESLKSADFQLLPGVDGDAIRKYIGPILSAEAKHPARALGTT
jgi:hypothetical protein